MESFRLFLHVFSASIWVGGQIALAGIVPTVRTLGPDAPKKVAHAFNRIAWPAFGVMFATGVWNLLAIDMNDINQGVFGAKFLLVIVSGGGAALHIVAKNKAALAIGGAMSSLGAAGAMYLGFLLR